MSPTPPCFTLFPYTTLFRSKSDRCEDVDIPDVMARAVRRRGEIVLFSGTAPRNYYSYGPDFDRLKRSCAPADRKSTRLNSSHVAISYAVFCLKIKLHTLHPR